MTDIEKKPKKVKNAKRDGRAAPDATASPAKAVKSTDADGMKTKKKRKSEAEAGEAVPAAEPPVKKKKKAKLPTPSPAASGSGDSAASDQSLVVSAPETDAAEPPAQPADPLAIDNFALSPAIKALLRKKGIEALFPIQAQTLEILLAGTDLVGRARTGCGKTLAFVLPIVQTLTGDAAPGGRRPFGRAPAVIVLAPTRELAKQVHADFEYIGAACGLATLCVYGGSPYGPQEGALRRGTDVVVGTPGRVKDLLEKGSLKLDKVRFRVLDECDEMLNMGFVEDVEKILGAGSVPAGVQTLLFSATLPAWVKDITARFLRPDHRVIDLVGNQRMKASTSVQHLVLPSHWSQRNAMVPDLVRCYGACGRSIVFTETKRDANDLVTALGDSVRALHGDIPQNQRESTLAGFRGGKFNVLVATDVAARGLDISGVELVLQVEPPKDPETYIHRSGRTGRAGSTGISVVLVDRKKESLIPFIERKAGLKFERIGAPQPQDVARIAANRAVEAIRGVDESVVSLFTAAAAELLADMPAEAAVARALAHMTGQTSMQARSLLTAHEDFTTLQFCSGGAALDRPGFVFGFLRRRGLPDADVEEVKRMTMTADGQGAVFDVSSGKVQQFMAKCSEAAVGDAAARGYLTVPAALPELKARAGGEASAFGGQMQTGGAGYGGRGYGGYGGGRGGGGRGGSGGSRGGRGSFGRRGGAFVSGRR